MSHFSNRPLPARSVLDHALLVEPLTDADGKSGAIMERATMPDGTVYVVKRIDPADDWVMQAADDEGRIMTMFEHGVFERLDSVINSAIVAVEPEESGFVVVMHDVSDTLIPDGIPLSRSDGGRLLEGLSAMHVSFLDSDPTSCGPLLDLGDYFTFLSPASALEMNTKTDIPSLITRGWEAFGEIFPVDVVEAVFAVHQDPAPYAQTLREHPSTLLHGDAKVANLGLGPDQVVALDWGALTTWGPPAVEYAYFLAVNDSAIDATLDEMLADVTETSAAGPDDHALELAVLGALAQLGWDKAASAISDRTVAQARQLDSISWWTRRARTAIAAVGQNSRT